MGNWIQRLGRQLKHRILDRDASHALPQAARERIAQAIAASEAKHTGQIRVYVETALPWSYIRRDAPARERAVMEFAKQRVWDTEHNNGILIYILLEPHAIEIVADRGYNRCVAQNTWQDITDRLRERFQQHDYLQGLSQALDRITDTMAQCYPADPAHVRTENLPNAPVILDPASKR